MLDGTTTPYNTPEALFTGYHVDGKEVVAVKPSGRPVVYRNPTFFDMNKKTDAATLYCVYGSFEEVSKLTDVPIPTLRQWREEAWWGDVAKKVFIEQNEGLSARISVVLSSTIENLTDRLENGDTTYNPKTGVMTRKPIEAKTLVSLFDSLAHQRRITRNEPTSISARVGTDDRLKLLEDAFVRFAAAKTITEDGEVLNA